MKTLLAALTVAIGALMSSHTAQADPQDVFSIDGAPSPRDTAYLHMIRVDNGITAGQDNTLLAYAHEWCAGGETPSGVPLIFQQGFPYGGIYIVRVAASKYYCPNHVAVEPPGVGGPTMAPYPYGM